MGRTIKGDMLDIFKAWKTGEIIKDAIVDQFAKQAGPPPTIVITPEAAQRLREALSNRPAPGLLAPLYTPEIRESAHLKDAQAYAFAGLDLMNRLAVPPMLLDAEPSYASAKAADDTFRLRVLADFGPVIHNPRAILTHYDPGPTAAERAKARNRPKWRTIQLRRARRPRPAR